MAGTHARTQIRREVKQALHNLPTTQGRVFTGRAYPLSEKERPGLFVVTPTERSEVSSIGAVKLDRVAEIMIVGYADGPQDSVEDLLDQMALEVEQAIAVSLADKSTGLGVLVKEMVLVRTEKNIPTDEAKRVIGEVRLAFETLFRTTRAAPETIIP